MVVVVVVVVVVLGMLLVNFYFFDWLQANFQHSSDVQRLQAELNFNLEKQNRMDNEFDYQRGQCSP